MAVKAVEAVCRPGGGLPARPRRRGRRRRLGAFGPLAHLALLLWAALIVGPILWTFPASFKTTTEIFGDPVTLPSSYAWDAWGRAFQKAHIGRYLLNTVSVTACGTAATMLLGSMAAYVPARHPFPGNRVIYCLFVSGMTFPVLLALVPLFFVVRDLGLLDTHLGVIVVYTAYSLPFTLSMAIIPVMIVYIVFQRQIQSGLTSGAVK